MAEMQAQRSPQSGGLDLLAFDRNHLWHPYSSMTRPSAPFFVESASGTRHRLRVDGEPREVIDAMASWWCAIHGYAVRELDDAARAQLDRMSHVMFGGLTHEPARKLARRLVALAPGSGGALASSPQLAAGSAVLDKVFLADSGSVAVDFAMKMLTGGYLTLAAVLTTADVADRVDASAAGAMMHGPTFMANPVACAVACASLELLARHDNTVRIAGIETALRAGLAPAADLAPVREVGALGAVGVMKLDRPVDVPAVTRAALDTGVWVRPFRNLVYAMPPFVSTADDLAAITTGIMSAIKQVHG
jgi:adenosylmethionine-8-amino-7-oxononanoate aminotransferase